MRAGRGPAEGEAWSPGSRAITRWQQSYASCPGARHPSVYLLCTCVCVDRGRRCGREGKDVQLKPGGGLESGAEGPPCRLKTPEKPSVLDSQHESPFIPPALLFPRKPVLQQVLCMTTLTDPCETSLLFFFLGWRAPVE